MEVKVKSIINIFTIIDGKINLLVKDNKIIEIECLDELDIVNSNYIKENIDIEDLSLKQCFTLSKKEEDKLNLTVIYMDIVNYKNIKLNDTFNFKQIDVIKDNVFVQKSIECLKKELVLNSTIKRLYPGEFILPEIQRIYEDLLDKKYDRRNFRKKLIKLDVIEDLDKISSNKTGRPAKLYRFKDIKEDKILF